MRLYFEQSEKQGSSQREGSYFDYIKRLALSATAKDTGILFAGNIATAFFAFLFILIVARTLPISDFGIFSAVSNLIIILFSISDLGTSTGLVGFVARAKADRDTKTLNEYLKAGFVIRLAIAVVVAGGLAIFAPVVSRKLFTSADATLSYWAAITIFGMLLVDFFGYALQALRRFLASAIVNNAFAAARPALVFPLIVAGILTIRTALATFFVSSIVGVLAGFLTLGMAFLFARLSISKIKRLLSFSSWLAVNKVASAAAGRLDIQLLIILAGAAPTGIYSVAARLASFIPLLTGSFAAVLAPRFASFGKKEEAKTYLLKSALAIVPMVGGVILWIIIAQPFIKLLFGEKFLDSVPVFQGLAASMIPFLGTAPSVSAIIYGLKKPIFIGVFSLIILPTTFLLNWLLIPIFGVFGPVIAFSITNSALFIFSWFIVIREYWFK